MKSTEHHHHQSVLRSNANFTFISQKSFTTNIILTAVIFKRRIFCILRQTRLKLLSNEYTFPLMTIFNFFYFDTFLKRKTNLKSMFSALFVQ